MIWAEQEMADCDDKYLLALRRQYDKYIDTGSLMETLSDIEDWCAYRNEIIHALMNKSIEDVELGLAEKAAYGMRLCRELDSQVDRLKNGNKIRRSLNLQNK